MKYLINTTAGPGFSNAEQTVQVLEKTVLPAFEALIKLEASGKILAGGLPVGDRSFVFIVESPDNEAVDELLSGLPIWGVLNWQVTPLQSFAGRADVERRVASAIKADAA
jgi:muconolactone delta-isomerase